MIDCSGVCQGCRKSFKSLGIERPHFHHKNGKNWDDKPSNFLVLCPNCHNRLHTYKTVKSEDDWGNIVKKRVLVTKKKSQTLKGSLNKLNVATLKALAKKHGLKVRGKIQDDFFGKTRKAPTKAQYVNKLSKVVSESDIKKARAAKPVKKKKKKKSSDDEWGLSWIF